ncbi:MAG: NADAR family protein [Myxococcales bacterium]|nr:NADAR family protein [Myxococcales bacterium]
MNAHILALHARQLAGEELRFRFFWGHSGSGYGPWLLSQWWEAPFSIEGNTYRTAEHWMMAQKALLFDDVEAHAKILAATTPGAAKALGRKVKDFDDRVWNDARFGIVRAGNVEKFRQNPPLLAWLLSTGDDVLVEASPVDRIWGIGLAGTAPGIHDVTTWKGENLLGFALSQVRDRLRRFPHPRVPEGAPLPPWIAHPEMHRYSIGWRMGYGEDHLTRFHAYWGELHPEELIQLELVYPAVGVWSGWYDPMDEDAWKD